VNRATRLFLLGGCALILALDTPGTVVLVRDAWSGPYAHAEEARTSAVAPAELELLAPDGAPSLRTPPRPLAPLAMVAPLLGPRRHGVR